MDTAVVVYIVWAVVGASAGYMIASIKKRDPVWKDVNEEEQRWEYTSRNIIATLIVIGFFAVIFTLFSGVVDLTNNTVAGFVGVILGHVSAKLDPVISKMFDRKVEPYEEEDK